MGWVTICYLAFQSGFKAISVWNLDMKFGYSESAFPNSYNTSFFQTTSWGRSKTFKHKVIIKLIKYKV